MERSEIDKRIISALTGTIIPPSKPVKSQWGYMKDKCLVCGGSFLQRGGYIQHWNRVHKTDAQVEAIKAIIKEEKINMANSLIDKEGWLYKQLGNDERICAGVKLMADEVREYF